MRAFACMTMLIAGSALAGCEMRKNGDSAAKKENAPLAAPVFRTAGDTTLQWGACPAPLPAGCELSVLHGDPAKPNADVLLRVPGGSVIPPHTHSSAERMVLVSGRLDVRYQGAQPATLLPGTYAYGPAEVPHTASCVAAEPCTLFIAFEGPVDVKPYEGEIR